MRSWSAILLVLAAGCYRSAPEQSCHVVCGGGAGREPLCPNGLVCGPGGLCMTPDGTCAPEIVDGAIDGPPDDSSKQITDAADDAPAGMSCYGHTFKVCFPQPVSGPTVVPGGTISTSFPPTGCTLAMTTDGHPLCVITGESVMIAGAIRAEGIYPLAIVANSTIEITASIDVADQPGMNRGAGSPSLDCSAGTAATAPNPIIAGGGAGGSFGALGGEGGTDTSGIMTGTGGTPGAAASIPTFPRAGCDGQPGATAAIAGMNTIRFGRGGGAVIAIANGSIVLASGATIDASGGGAPVSSASSGQIGAGGGGSGGLVSLDAPTITLLGTVMANGGGGAAGTTGNDGAGHTPIPPMYSAPALGGSSGTGGAGGAGGFRNTPAESAPGVTDEAGGGGGGSIGYVLLHGNHSGSMISPLPL